MGRRISRGGRGYCRCPRICASIERSGRSSCRRWTVTAVCERSRANEPSAHSRPWRNPSRASVEYGSSATLPGSGGRKRRSSRSSRRSCRAVSARSGAPEVQSRTARLADLELPGLPTPQLVPRQQLDQRRAPGLSLDQPLRLGLRRTSRGNRVKPADARSRRSQVKSCVSSSRTRSDITHRNDWPPFASTIPKCASPSMNPAMKWPSASEIVRSTCKSYLSERRNSCSRFT